MSAKSCTSYLDATNLQRFQSWAQMANQFAMHLSRGKTLNPISKIFTIVQQIADAGRGEEFVAALNSKEIKREFWSWSN